LRRRIECDHEEDVAGTRDISTEKDPETLRQIVQLLSAENEHLHTRIAALSARVDELENKQTPEQLALELATLQEQMDRLQRRLFSDSSEKRSTEPKRPPPAEPQTGHGPTEQPDLPHVETTVELADDDKICDSCGGELEDMGDQTEDSELIDVIERKFIVRKIKRRKYRCRCGCAIKTAPAPVKPIEGGRYSLDFAAHVVTDKYTDHSPLDRQRKTMLRDGLVVSTATLWDQVHAIATWLEPVYDVLRQYILSADVIGVDETHWRLLSSKNGGKKWWVWALTSRDAVWYGINPSRSAKVATEYLDGFEGVAVCDAYKVYQTVQRIAAQAGLDFILALCWSHARRHFVEAEANYPQCGHAIDLIGKLFAIDRETTDPTLLHGDRKLEEAQRRLEGRQSLAPPLLEELREWALAQRGRPKSGLRKAIDYLLSNWKGLTVFVNDPYVPLHNNDTEQAMRGPVVGRKNHYGSRSERGTRAAAICYSIVETARRNGLNPHAYIVEAIKALDAGVRPQDVLPLQLLWRQSARA
jgi:transposase